MQPRRSIPPQLQDLARRQAGVVTREQARGLGLTDAVLARLGRDRWRRLASGVYFTADVDPAWDSVAWGGVLAGGDHARLGPHASAWAHGLISVPPQPIDVLVPHGRGGRPESRSRHPHRALLRAALGDIGQGAESLLEVRYLRDVERAHGLPRGHRQRRLVPGGYRTDVKLDRYALVIELDGRVFHDGVLRFRDLDHDNVAALTGQLTLRYGWFDTADRPCRIAAQVAVRLAERGWPGVPTRCPRCRHLSDSDWEGLWGIVA